MVAVLDKKFKLLVLLSCYSTGIKVLALPVDKIADSSDYVYTSPTVVPTNFPPVVTELVPEENGAGYQRDYWDCGPSSLARLLRYSGHQDATYKNVREFIEPRVKVFFNYKLGTDPALIKATMDHWQQDGSGTVEQEASYDHLIALLKNKTPVMALIYLGTITDYALQVPNLHWVMVNGYEEGSGKILITDTADEESWIGKYEFLSKWDWQLEESIYLPLVVSTVKILGHKTRTMGFFPDNSH